MPASFEARYLKIDWRGPNAPRRIECSQVPIRIEPGEDGTPELEIQIFPDDFSIFGFRLLETQNAISPSWFDATGERRPFTMVRGETGTEWWVPLMEWDEVKRRHFTPFTRSLGTYRILLAQNQEIALRTIQHEQDRIVLEDYLKAFKDDLIWLVFGLEGAGRVAGDAGPGAEIAKALGDFARAVDRVSRHLATEMCERTAGQPRHKLRPNAETFRHHVRNPLLKQLPGRVAEESADLPDNRFLRHMVQQCSRVIRQMAPALKCQSETLRDRAKRAQEDAVLCEQIDFIQIDPAVFDAQTAQIEEQLEEICKRFPALSCIEEARQTFPLELENIMTKWENSFFFKKINENLERQHNRSFNRATFSKEAYDLLVENFGMFKKYKFTSRKRNVKHSGKPYGSDRRYFLKFVGALQIEPVTDALDDRRRMRAGLESNDWRKPLNAEQRQEYRRLAEASRRRANTIVARAGQLDTATAAVESTTAVLRRIDRAFAHQGIGVSSRLPAGMRFNMNADYAACLAAWRKVQAVMQQSGLSGNALDRLESISTLHASAIYEQWCLIKILVVLMEEYAFIPPDDWTTRLIDKMTGSPEALLLKLERPDIGLVAKLEYQPELANGRRPDFRLRFHYPTALDLPDRGEPKHDNDPKGRSGLVMDAKFRSRWPGKSLKKMIDELVVTKRYGLEEDRVFVLHPVANSIAPARSPLVWGPDCDYGQAPGQKHRSGSIHLSPSVGLGDEHHHLRRLISLQLQQTFGIPPERSSLVHTDDMIDQDEPFGEATDNCRWFDCSFCVFCGKAHQREDIIEGRTEGGKPKWHINCSGCDMQTERTHCHVCQFRLFKNGTVQTYHQTMAENPTDIACPKCGSGLTRTNGKSRADDPFNRF